MPEKSTDLWTRWEKCPSPAAAAAHDRLRTAFLALFDETTVVSARWTALPFYQHHRIIELGLRRAGTDARVFVLDGNDATWWLDGNSDAIYYVNDAEGLSLTAASAADYLRFFCYFLRANDEPFRIIESDDELTATDFADETILRSAAAGGDAQAKPVWENLQAARAGVGPLRTNTTEQGARFLFSAAVVYGVHRWAAVFAVTSEGAVEMVDDQPVTELVGVQAPTYPKLRPEWEPPTAHAETPDDDDLDEQTGSAPANVDEQAFLAAWRGEVGAEPPVQTDKEVTEAVVGALLEDAVRRLDGGSVLLQHFNAETATDNPIKGLARLVQMTSPAIVIESDIPFVEEFVGSLIAHADPEVAARRQVRAVAVPGDDGKCQFDVGTGTATYFISLHAYRTIVDVERTAHELGIRDAAVLIGAARVSDVPQPLFQLIDAVLRLPGSIGGSSRESSNASWE